MNPHDSSREVAERASQQARENHQRFVDQENQRRFMDSSSRHEQDLRRYGGRGGSGFLGTLIGIVILAVLGYIAYMFVMSSGLLS